MIYIQGVDTRLQDWQRSEFDLGLTWATAFRGGIVRDESPNRVNGSLVNSPRFTYKITDNPASEEEGAYNFVAASTQYVNTNIANNPSSGDFTLCTWFRATVSSTCHLISQRLGGGTFHQADMVLLSNGYQLYVQGTGGPGAAASLTVTRTYYDGKPHFFVGTRLGNTFCLYIDGILEATATAAVGTVSPSVNWLLAVANNSGAPLAGNYYSGDMGETRIYLGRALTTGDVANLYDLGFLSQRYSSLPIRPFFSRYYYDMPAGNRLVA